VLQIRCTCASIALFVVVLLIAMVAQSEQKANRSEFLEDVATATVEAGCNTLSWIRSSDHNESVGGAEESLHLTGEAVDTWCYSQKAALALLRELKSKGYYTEWNGDVTVHVQIRRKK